MDISNQSLTTPIKDTPQEQIDAYLKQLKEKQVWWAHQVSLNERIALLKQVQQNILKIMDEWIVLDAQSKQTPTAHWDYATSAITPGSAGLATRLYLRMLEDIRDYGKPRFAKNIQQEGDRVQFDIFPQDFKDGIVWRGVKGTVYLQSGTRVEHFDQYQENYQDPHFEGGVSLILASGNYAHLTFYDTFHKLIAQKNVVLIKINPVKAYLSDILTTIFKPFMDAGVIRVIEGGASVGHYVSYHPLVDAIHMTGSDKTFEAIVYGSGSKGISNKEKDHRLLNIPITGELGCVTPIIIVPGEWQEEDFHYQAKNIVSMLGFNSGFTCCAPRVLSLPKGWDGSLRLMHFIRHYMREMSIASNYYPGTNDRITLLEKQYPHLEKIGLHDATHQPWMLMTDLDPHQNEYAFRVEVWAAFMSQVYLPFKDTHSYLHAAVEFANSKLWGTLSAMILIDTKTQKELEKTACLQQALLNLRYGVVTVNIFSGYANTFGLIPWGGYPGSGYQDIQSGNDYVNNLMLLKNVDKTSLSAPFRPWPESPTLITNKKIIAVARAFSRYNITGAWRDFFKLIGRMFF